MMYDVLIEQGGLVMVDLAEDGAHQRLAYQTAAVADAIPLAEPV